MFYWRRETKKVRATWTKCTNLRETEHCFLEVEKNSNNITKPRLVYNNTVINKDKNKGNANLRKIRRYVNHPISIHLNYRREIFLQILLFLQCFNRLNHSYKWSIVIFVEVGIDFVSFEKYNNDTIIINESWWCYFYLDLHIILTIASNFENLMHDE